MATKITRSTTAVKATVKTTRKPAAEKSKSDIARGLLKSGKSINQVVEAMSKMNKPMGYPFVYGVAKRSGLHLTAAGRRPEAGSKFTDFAKWLGIPEAQAVSLGVAFSHSFPRPAEIKVTVQVTKITKTRRTVTRAEAAAGPREASATVTE